MCNLSDGVFEKGIEKGIEQGINLGVLASIRNLIDTMGLTAEQAMDALRVSPEVRDTYYRQYPD